MPVQNMLLYKTISILNVIAVIPFKIPYNTCPLNVKNICITCARDGLSTWAMLGVHLSIQLGLC